MRERSTRSGIFSSKRVVTEDVEVSGQAIPAGTYVQVAVAVANRDPAEHPDPDTIDFQRQERHFAFGGGPHGCLGSHLARLEMRVALEEWHRRIPEYELARFDADADAAAGQSG